MKTEETVKTELKPSHPYSIRFPWRYDRRARRWDVDYVGLSGARACAARMVSLAEMQRVTSMKYAQQSGRSSAFFARMYRMRMRQSALWARLFAGQIADADVRLREVEHRLDEQRSILAATAYSAA